MNLARECWIEREEPPAGLYGGEEDEDREEEAEQIPFGQHRPQASASNPLLQFCGAGMCVGVGVSSRASSDSDSRRGGNRARASFV